MADVKVPKVPSKEWIETTIEQAKKAQEIYATDPERYREYLKEFERKEYEVDPNESTDEEKIAQMQVNMKALMDADPKFIPGFDLEMLKTTMTYVNKVKERFEESQPDTYKQFLAVWESEKIPQPPTDRMWERIRTQIRLILAGEPDLLEGLDSLAPPDRKASELK